MLDPGLRLCGLWLAVGWVRWHPTLSGSLKRCAVLDERLCLLRLQGAAAFVFLDREDETRILRYHGDVELVSAGIGLYI